TSSPNTAQYAMLDYMLKATGHTDMHVATIEGYPTMETAEALVKASGRKKIRLIPFLFVAGDHANNDIAVEWKEALEAKGYEVEPLMEGLGENAAIRQLFIDHAQAAAAAAAPWRSAAEEKKAFIQNNQ
ncbi:MAG: sirohydrochlorin cobaltochelatase, partial [Parabacteroides sp.]|nr:sirohydrochlorin cobaltochelatase [Parabacteroides sp.]